MSWTYKITSGTLLDRDGKTTGLGYSGHGDGLNNPSMCSASGVGPLPQGTYTIGAPHDNPHVGLFAMYLTPDPSNTMFGRSAFYIHGDNPSMNHTASDGCIILGRFIREKVAKSGDNNLVVED